MKKNVLLALLGGYRYARLNVLIISIGMVNVSVILFLTLGMDFQRSRSKQWIVGSCESFQSKVIR